MRGSSSRWWQDEWVLGTVAAAPDEMLQVGRRFGVSWLGCPTRGTFLADPFPTRDGGIVCEEFRYLRACGALVSHRVRKGKLVDRTVLSDGVGHYSYPFVLNIDNEELVVPERSRRGGVHLYRLTDMGLVYERCLIPAVRAMDTTIVHYGGLWWAFYSDLSGLAMGHRLDIWYSETLTGEWQPHADSPWWGDQPTLRPAGSFFEVDGRLYRPTQDCTETYGGRILIQEIDSLTPASFSEHTVSALQVTSGPYADGIHTLNTAGSGLLVDGKRRRVRVDALAGRALRKARSSRSHREMTN